MTPRCHFLNTILVAASTISLAAISFAAGAATSPSTAASLIKPTADQAALIDKVHSQPIDEPYPKYNLHFANRDGTPNAQFGKLDTEFISKHEAFLARDKAGPIGLLFIGDSITEGWNKRASALWSDRYAKLNAANFGIGGDRTENVLWRIANGELDGISPKVVVLMIGINDHHSPRDQIIKADTKIVQRIHEKLPETKVLLLGLLPHGVDPNKNKNVADMRDDFKFINAGLAKLDDGNKTRFLDMTNKFLTPDGVLSSDVMPDALNPSAKGYQIWADAMQPLLDEMMK
jgi:lysophospholipase L1-like esterase